MTPPVQSNRRGAVFALAAFGLFSTHDVIVKYLGGTYSPIQILFFSVLFGFPLVTIALLQDRTDSNLIPRHPWWTALRTGAAVVVGISAFYAFSVLPLAQTYAILFMTPLLITILSVPLLGEVVRLRRWAAVVIGLVGVFVVLDPAASDLGLGHLAALLAATGSAIAAIVMRKIGGEERSVVMMLYPMVANFVVMGSLLPFVYVPMPAQHLGAVALIALLGSLAAFLVIQSYKRAEAVVVAPMQYSQILWATGFGFVLFGERPEQNVVIGAAIIVASGVYILLREGRGGASLTRPVLRAFHLRQDTGTLPRIGLWLGRKNDEDNGH
ncbi:S-adenosylmethionine uptake transporter [Rubricella aquisinus]|uniref:S-adenosylmethionine uptake transporter n=1 Tax=Rubricella aquisinus TaxID=2028108 RepID=A0A840WJ78_9RHOB|nr:DMT family transporter [Rubricella aquisinus]MBB5514253.1 S-adenosylmethionine uptake transporter [Rubricella aquisinus]